MKEIIITVVSSLILLTLSEVIKEWLFSPYAKYMDLRGRVSFALTMYAGEMTSPLYSGSEFYQTMKPAYTNASNELRKLACEVEAIRSSRYHFQPGVPKKIDLQKTSSALIGLSNCLFTSSLDRDNIDWNIGHINEIKTLFLKDHSPTP